MEQAATESRGERSRAWRAARAARIVVQFAFLAFFVYLLFAALQRRAAFPLADFFFRVDPLAALTSMLSARTWLPRVELALITVGLTLVLGRVWCGWICPLGTVAEWIRLPGARRRAKRLPPRLRSAKYVVLIVVVAMAALGSMTLMVLDPVALFTRTMTTAGIPGLDYAVTSLETAANHVSWLQGGVSWLEDRVRGPVLPAIQPVYAQGVLIGLLFVVIIGLNALADRFWCRYLCPLGALLGLVAKVSLLRPAFAPACDRCNRCAAACRLGAIEVTKAGDEAARAGGGAAAPPPALAASECTMCLDCLATCPEGGMTIAPTLKPSPWRPYDPSRRQFVTAAAAGIGGVVLLGTGLWNRLVSPWRLRPPGVSDESTFVSTCLRCSQCMRVCPTGGLQPATTQVGLEAFWTPVLQPRVGYCDYACTACGHICPSGAIPKLDLETKRTQRIGLAVIDRDRCLPWSQEQVCVVCQEVCPLTDKAVALTGARMVTDAQGVQNRLAFPVVKADRCIGCGICEYNCPVPGPAAIRVFAVGGTAAVTGTG